MDFEDEDDGRVYVKGSIKGLELPLNALFYLNKKKSIYITSGLAICYTLNEKTIYVDDEPRFFLDPNDNTKTIEISLKGYRGNFYFESHYREFVPREEIVKFNIPSFHFDGTGNIKNNFNQINLSPHLGFGLKINLGENIQLQFEPTFRFYASPIYKNDVNSQMIGLLNESPTKHNIRIYSWNVGITTKLMFHRKQ